MQVLHAVCFWAVRPSPASLQHCSTHVPTVRDAFAASKRLLAFYDSAVDARCAPLADVSGIAMPAKTKPSLKFALWLKGEGTNFMAAAQVCVCFSRLCEPWPVPE